MKSVNLIRLQGLIFCALTAVMLLVGASLQQLPAQVQLLFLALAIVIFGVPHGALDPLLAGRLYPLKSAFGWVVFALVYLLLAAAVVLLWWLAPVFFLIAFLVISAAHFSGDPVGKKPWWFRFVYGGAVLVLPALLHAKEVAELFSFLINPSAANALTEFLNLLAWPWLLAVLAACALQLRADWLASLELLCVAALASWISPLLAFALFFCAMHGARHVLRVKAFFADASFSSLLRVAAPPMLALTVGAALAWQWMPEVSVSARVVQLLFVALAALTVPHMCLVERVRFGGWVGS
jgi:Brp/Blh family beta-carotene 15,15'-monooxygenase